MKKNRRIGDGGNRRHGEQEDIFFLLRFSGSPIPRFVLHLLATDYLQIERLRHDFTMSRRTAEGRF